MFPTVLQCIALRCFRADCTIAALLHRSFYGFIPILVGHEPATLVLSMLIKAWIECRASRPWRWWCAYEDSTHAIYHDRPLLIVVEAALMYELGLSLAECVNFQNSRFKFRYEICSGYFCNPCTKSWLKYLNFIKEKKTITLLPALAWTSS